ncbi:uncharacterized protein SPSK_10320 [Sporothrix schenckii 1099-18]|uniref:methylated diphthine methylhydrolase n=1 Tax=Sporothrix schenckii 1099-18 TaxID=1397361 RepID=A0A0F2LSM7_SPOSC|nr:uncharacterized protein SPSK_10320 [Sporothrix schenckii 1099-18]KJR79884.1 hypothetical protein SPSK_10320 [Sporothrix schenckii 1099-18]
MTESSISIESHTLDLPPSCIEFCPGYPDYFCVGTYNLVQDEARAQGDVSRPQNRNGSIVPSAILDLHFQQLTGKQDVFAVVSSTASLSIFRLTPSAPGGRTVELISVARVDGVGEDTLFLACAWHPSTPNIIAVSTSSGEVYIIAINTTKQSTVVSKIPAITHDLETWAVAFSPPVFVPLQALDGSNTETYNGHGGFISTLYSGSDDSLLKYTCVVSPQPVNGSEVSPGFPTGICKLTGHNAGVTAILPTPIMSPDGGRVVVTGSYDDHVRVYSILDPATTGGIRRVSCLAEQCLGGGVWRLKLVSHTTDDGTGCWGLRVLASCMYAGALVIDISGNAPGKCQVMVRARFKEHKSMNYGSDFQQRQSLLCISTSFYDKLLCLWEVKQRWHGNLNSSDCYSANLEDYLP